MSGAFSLAFVAALFNDGFRSSVRMSDHAEVPISSSVARTLRSLFKIFGRSMSKAGRSVSVLTDFVNDCTYVVQHDRVQ